MNNPEYMQLLRGTPPQKKKKKIIYVDKEDEMGREKKKCTEGQQHNPFHCYPDQPGVTLANHITPE